MRFLVTGGAGFVGSHLVEYLHSAGHQVVILDNFATGKRSNLPAGMDPEIIEGSIVDPLVCARAMRRIDFVLHQAALPSVPRSIDDPVGAHEANASGTLRLLIAARDAGVRRFVLAGSSSAYGNTAVLPKHEDMPSRPLSPYAASKLAAEDYCRAFNKAYGLQTVVLRYFNIFGPRQDPSSQYAAVVPKFITCALENEPPTICGDGEQTRDFTYVANVVRANLLACEASSAVAGETINVACGSRVTVNELWRRIAALTGTKAQPRHLPVRTGDVRDSVADTGKAARLLGFLAEVQLEEGLRRTIESFTVGLNGTSGTAL